MSKTIIVRHFSSYSIEPAKITVDPAVHKSMVEVALAVAHELGLSSYKNKLDELTIFEDDGMDLNVTRVGDAIEAVEDLVEEKKYVLALRNKENLRKKEDGPPLEDRLVAHYMAMEGAEERFAEKSDDDTDSDDGWD